MVSTKQHDPPCYTFNPLQTVVHRRVDHYHSVKQQGFFFWCFCSSEPAKMYSCSLHTAASSPLPLKAHVSTASLASCCESQAFNRLGSRKRGIPRGVGCPLHFLKSIPRRRFSQMFFSQSFHLKHVAWSAIWCLFGLSNLQEILSMSNEACVSSVI